MTRICNTKLGTISGVGTTPDVGQGDVLMHLFMFRHAVRAAISIVILAALTVVVAPTVRAATPTGPFTVDLTSRESVRRFFYDVHEASEGIPINWTGNIAGCDPGTVSPDFLDATRTRINYFRAMAGVPSDVVFTAANNTEAQATALIMSARNGTKPQLSHDPPPDWKCWTQLGRDGAARSNLQVGSTGPAAIDASGARQRPGRAPAHDAQPAELLHGVGLGAVHRHRERR